MARKRLTQMLPFLTPIRIWQRRLFYQINMLFDSNHYAKTVSSFLPYTICSSITQMINEQSGYDMIYQQNKVDNLKIISFTMNQIVIRPGEVFSFCYLLRGYKQYGKMKEGLVLVDGKIVPRKGGGICHLSNLLYFVFLLSPLTIMERHGHKKKTLPNPDQNSLAGVDATINQGWLDLKVRNDTKATYQVVIDFKDSFMRASILSDEEWFYEADILNENFEYIERDGKIYEQVSVVRVLKDKKTKKVIERKTLYEECVEVAYALPDCVEIRRGK